MTTIGGRPIIFGCDEIFFDMASDVLVPERDSSVTIIASSIADIATFESLCHYFSMELPFRLFSQKRPANRIHLDYASSTPVHSEVFTAMRPYFTESWANPSAVYTEGVHARLVIESERKELARAFHVRPDDIIFTSGGTESNNLAVTGIVEAYALQGVPFGKMHVISTLLEHPSILETLKYLERRGVRVSYIPVSSEGLIDLHALEGLCTRETILITFASINSEIGTVQDVKKITRFVRKWNTEHNANIKTHIDASQAPLWVSCMPDMLGVDMMTLDAGKCYGPKGVGVLVRRHGVSLAPVLHGGGQEGGLRSGTENVPLIVGCVCAILRAQKNYVARSAKTQSLREYCFDMLLRDIPNAVANGSREHRVANNINISIPGVDTEYATIWLDTNGIAVSTKSACGAGKGGGSAVVREISHDEPRAQATLRITLGEDSTKTDIERMVHVLSAYLKCMKKVSEGEV